MVQSTRGGLLRYSVGLTRRGHSLHSEFRCAPVEIDNAFAVVQVLRRMPSGLLGGGRSLKETPTASPLSFDANDDDADDDPELAAAIAASLVTNSDPLSADVMRLKETPPASPLSFDADDDPELAEAIAASLVTNSAPLSLDAMRQARLARFG
jgi:hypothetical protein